MKLIASYHSKGFEAVADGVMEFFDRRQDLQTSGIAFGENSKEGDLEPGERSSGEKCPLVRVVQEVAETLPASPVPAYSQSSPLSLVEVQLGFALIG